jgi:hypothetical protein
MAMLPVYARDRARSTITATVLLFVLGVCLVGCTSAKSDPDPQYDETQRQHLQIASFQAARLLSEGATTRPRTAAAGRGFLLA